MWEEREDCDYEYLVELRRRSEFDGATCGDEAGKVTNERANSHAFASRVACCALIAPLNEIATAARSSAVASGPGCVVTFTFA